MQRGPRRPGARPEGDAVRWLPPGTGAGLLVGHLVNGRWPDQAPAAALLTCIIVLALGEWWERRARKVGSR